MSIVRVAKLAGVSNSTVSRVINNHPRVSDETAKAVHAAMEKLKYKPSPNRPGPKPGSKAIANNAATICMLVLGGSRDRATPAFEQLMRGVSRGAAEFGLKLVYQHVVDMTTLPQQILDGTVDGLLLHGNLPSESLRKQLQKFPTVWLMGNRRRPDWGDQVMPDTYEVGDKAARYLIHHGHKHLAYLNLDRGHWPFRVASQSFLAAAHDAGLHCDIIERQRTEDERAYWTQYAVNAAEELVAQFLKLPAQPTGIFVADDMQVAIIQPALQRAGVKIGKGHVEVISCNNERPYLMGLSPLPAEVDIRVEAIGFRGVDRLLWRMAHRDVAERIVTAVDPFVLDHHGKPADLTSVGR